MPNDRYGLSLATSALAAAAYVDAVDRLLAARERALEGFDRALAIDPAFALAHIGRSRSLLVGGRGPEGRDAASAALALVGRLANTLVRQFKNPLAIIRGASDAAGAETVAPRIREWAKDGVRKQVDRMNNLINEFLEFTRGSASTTVLARANYAAFVTPLSGGRRTVNRHIP